MNKKLVSVVIPAFNGEAYLAQAIRSVLDQDYPRVELIVVDDGSSDRSAEIAGSFAHVRLLRQPNRGNAAARNAGIESARGDRIALLDQDDIWLPSKLARQSELLDELEETGVCLCRQRFQFEEGVECPPWLHPKLRQDHMGYAPSCWMVSKDLFGKIGPFDSSFKFGSEVDWLFRATEQGVKTVKVPQTLVLRRVHPGNQSNQLARMKEEMLRLVRSSVKRKLGDHGRPEDAEER